MINIKRLLLILILTFSFQTLSKADDIRDFQVEGMSVGDSLLDYFNRTKIDNIKYKPWKDKKTYFQFYTDNNLSEYDVITFAFLIKDENYKIDEISGRKFMNYNQCKLKLDEISLKISSLFSSAYKNDKGEYSHRIDNSKKSKVRGINYILKDGSLVHTACYDWSNKLENEKNYKDSLNIAIATSKYVEWQKTKAYK